LNFLSDFFVSPLLLQGSFLKKYQVPLLHWVYGAQCFFYGAPQQAKYSHPNFACTPFNLRFLNMRSDTTVAEHNISYLLAAAIFF
jgi:hypothetical protein